MTRRLVWSSSSMSLSPDERTDLVVSWRETAWTPILTSRASEEEEEEGESGPGRKTKREHDRHMSHIELGLVRVLTDRTKPYAVRNTEG